MEIPQLEPVAQLVEHRTFNAVVAGSSPARLTKIFKYSHVFRFLSYVRMFVASFILSSFPGMREELFVESAVSFLWIRSRVRSTNPSPLYERV